MQPVTLHHRLRACGIDDPDASAWRLWRQGGKGGVTRLYVRRMGLLLFTVICPMVLVVLYFPTLFGVEVDLRQVAVGVAVGVAGGVAGGVAFGVAVFVTHLRLPLYPFEPLIQCGLFLIDQRGSSALLRYAPVLYHDLSYLPHPFLARHIVSAATRNPRLARGVLDACTIAPGQRRQGKNALAELQARELGDLLAAGRFADVVALQGEWLPGPEGADPLLLAFAEAGRYLQAAASATLAYLRGQHLQHAGRTLQALENQRLQARTPLARALPEPLAVCRRVLREISAETRRAAADQLPNPFRAGEPLTPEQGQEVFRGREALVARIESLLGDPDHSASIALIGPRRSGKSSLLKMLPVKLPDAVCVFFDLQDNPVDSPTAFFKALERRVLEQTRRDRRLALPRLPEGPPFETAAHWLEALDECAGDRRILIAIDEFERLEDLFPGDRRELLKLMGLFRATIQHRRKLRLLVSGAAPFDELDAIWNDHFINLREVAIGYLDEQTGIDLLQRPIPDFPEDAIPRQVAAMAFARCAGQPYLLQLYGSLLVTHLNHEKRRTANPDDLRPVEDELLSQAGYYFRDTYRGAPEDAREVLRALARGEPVEPNRRTRRWLQRRLLLTDDGHLQPPVLGTWIREEADD